MLPRMFFPVFLTSLLMIQSSLAEDSNRVIISKQGSAVTRVKKPNLNTVNRQILTQTNQFRKSQRLDPVRSNGQLNTAAQYFADFMARTGKYGHEADGKQPHERATMYGYNHAQIAENIASAYHTYGFATDELTRTFVDGWKNSPGHRKNMVDPFVLELGTAVAQSKDGTYYAVQLFGRPATTQYRFRIANQSGSKHRYQVRTLNDPKSERTVDLGVRVTATYKPFFPAEVRFQWMKRNQWQPVKDGMIYTVVRDGRGYAIQQYRDR